MSTETAVARVRERLDAAALWERFVGVAFGDRYGLTLFLAGLCFFALYWRVGIFITDNYTIANAVVAVGDGHLWLDEAVYGGTLDTPGMHEVDGRFYARNYGHVVAAVPFFWALEGLSVVADPRVALAALFSLGLLALGLQVGALVGRQRSFAYGGSAVALLALAANLAVATPLADRWLALVALQVSTMVAAALAGVVCYRLLARWYGTRVGLAAGVALVVATPVGFWASIPKRHVPMVLLTLVALYGLARSRRAGPRALQFRAAAYAAVGLAAWIHAAEALLLLFVLAAVDVPSAPRNDPRALAVVAGVFVLSLLPFLLTNFLISGEALRPPRMLPRIDGGVPALAGGGGGGAAGGGGGGAAGGGGASTGGNLELLSDVLAPLSILVTQLVEGFHVSLSGDGSVYHTLVQGGYLERVVSDDGGETLNLAVLESAPLLAAALALPVVAIASVRQRGVGAIAAWWRSERGPVDLAVLLLGLLTTILYITRLPLHAQVTVRYLLVLFPLLVYAVARVPAVRRAVDRQTSVLGWSYAATILVGGQAFVLWLWLVDAALGEAIRLHGLVGLAVAGPGAVLVVAATAVDDDRLDAATAAWLGVAAGVATGFLLLSGIDYFAYAGEFALSGVEWLAGRLALT